MGQVHFGVTLPQIKRSWQETRAAAETFDSLGFDSVWLNDHLYGVPMPSLPILEAWTTLSAVAATTQRVRLGTLVSPVGFRNPALLAKMAATLDQISNGRVIVGLGCGWFQMEFEGYGYPFPSLRHRLEQLEEAAVLMKRLWTEPQVSFEGRHFNAREAFCEPKPVQRPHPPIMIGGGGEKLTLRVVAEQADQWNTFGSPEDFRRKIAILREHGRAVGRNTEEIEVSWAGVMHVTDSASEKAALMQALAETYGRPMEAVEPTVLVGSIEEIIERIGRYLEVGVTHFICVARPPFHHPSLRQFAERVIPRVRAEHGERAV